MIAIGRFLRATWVHRQPASWDSAHLVTAARWPRPGGVRAIALFRSEHIDGDTASVDRAGPASIERHVGDQPLQLGLRYPIVECPLHVAPYLVGPVERSQHCHRDQAAVTLAEVGMLPYVAEQHVVAELPQLGDEFVHRWFFRRHVSISSCMGRVGEGGSREQSMARSESSLPDESGQGSWV